MGVILGVEKIGYDKVSRMKIGVIAFKAFMVKNNHIGYCAVNALASGIQCKFGEKLKLLKGSNIQHCTPPGDFCVL